MLKRFNMDRSKAIPVPLAKGDKFSKAQCPNNQFELDEMRTSLMLQLLEA